MIRTDHYVPILKWKRAEQRAIQEIESSLRQAFTPVIELDAIPTNWETGENTRTFEEHVTLSLKALHSSWGKGAPFFLDCVFLADERPPEGYSVSDYVYQQSSELGLQFIPVTRLSNSRSEQGLAFNYGTRGVCLRLCHEDLGDELEGELRHFLDYAGNRDIDLIVDFGSVIGIAASLLRNMMLGVLTAVPRVQAWRTITVTGSSFPESMSGSSLYRPQFIERAEWIAWSSLRRGNQLPRTPTYGDYGIQHPQLPETFAPFMDISTNIRYTAGSRWLILKGPSFKRRGGAPYRGLAQSLIESDHFLGITHCAGCSEIQDISQRDASHGNPEVWRRIGAIHHITSVVEQLASLTVP